MKTIKTLVVEDEAPALKRLIKMIENHPELKLMDTAKSMKEAEEKILKLKPEIIFLDIQLKDADAFELLSKINHHFSRKIIFVTAFDIYAVKAFDADAIDYLLKPYSEERFAKAVQKAVSKIEKTNLENILPRFRNDFDKSFKTVIVPEGIKYHYIDNEKLIYLFSESYYTHFIFENERKMIRISLKKLDEILPENFIRINKSTIINKNYISEISHYKSGGKIILKDKNEFYISDNFNRKL